VPMELHVFFAFSISIEGTTEKVIQFISPYITKTLVSLNKKCIFEHYTEIETSKLLIDIIFVMKKNYDVLFRAALNRLMLVTQRCAVPIDTRRVL